MSKTVKKMSDSFELKYSGKVNSVIPVYKYKSNKTGLSVVIAQVDGPLVNGYFCLATEAHDDDGLPHTLEHLVFMGSEKYPYKGVLDLLANRSLASGTNAWTDTDHTCYTMTTAGSEGFLNLMPIFMDHVLYPTLTEAGYITEVHHVNGEGEDAGVVYCEMQSVENTGENLTRRALAMALYPGHCGYKSETGGAMGNLRESTSHEKVCAYHKAFYRPDNLCLVITGQVKPEEVMATIQPFEDHILSKGALPPYVRPWQSAVPPVEGSVDCVVPYPSDDEQNGMVIVGWRGPKAKDQYSMTALLILLEYLTDTAVAPLQREFVEVDDPYCNDVSYSITENSEGMFYLRFKNAPTGKLKDIKDKLFGVVGGLGDRTEEVDMSRMQSVIHRRVLEAQSSLEDSPHDTVAFHIIGDFLYGDTNDDLETRLNQIDTFKKLKGETADYWVKLINKFLVGTKYACIIGEPSTKLMEEMGKKEKDRVAEQRKTLGEEGLKQKAKVLEQATTENEVEPPESMLTIVDVPDVGCIHFHPIAPSSNHADPAKAGQPNAKFPLDKIPVTFQLDDIQTNFVTMAVLMDTSALSRDLRLYLPLYTEVILESPIMRDGVLVPHEQVITELAADTLENGCGIGVGGGRFSTGRYASLLDLTLKVEADKYKKGVDWLREIMYQVQFTPDRLKIIASKMSNDVASMKRKGGTVTRCLYKDMLFSKDSNVHLNSMLRQHKFLTSLLDKLDNEDSAKQIVADLNTVRDAVTDPGSLQIHVSASTDVLTRICKPADVWTQNFLPKDRLKQATGKRLVVPQPYESLLPPAEGPGTALIVGVGSVESSFLLQSTPCIRDFQDPDVPAVLVFMQYLTMLEGPMWRQIRGLGLSYHYSMYLKQEEGLMHFMLFRSTHVVNAYKQAKQIVDGYLSGKTPLSEVEFETCKSSLIFEIIEDEKTPADASEQSLLSYLRQVPKDYNRQLIRKIPKVTLADVKRVGPKYFAPLFDPASSKVAICCHPTKVQEICTDMKQFSRDLKVIDSLDDSFLAQI